MARIKIDDIPEDDSLDEADLNKIAGGLVSRLPSVQIRSLPTQLVPDGLTYPGVSTTPVIPSLSNDPLPPNTTNIIS